MKSKNEKEIIIKDIFENDKFVKEEQEENNIFINIDYNINFDYEKNINKIKKESDKEEKPVITKSAKITVTNEESTTQNFYEMTNRDPVTGKRIRSQSKILN